MIVKSVGSNGQITLGKEFAGRLVMLDQTEPGVWMLKLGQFIPDNERWLHTSEATKLLERGLALAARTQARNGLRPIPQSSNSQSSTSIRARSTWAGYATSACCGARRPTSAWQGRFG